MSFSEYALESSSLKKIMVELKRVFSKLLFFSSVLALFYNLLL